MGSTTYSVSTPNGDPLRIPAAQIVGDQLQAVELVAVEVANLRRLPLFEPLTQVRVDVAMHHLSRTGIDDLDIAEVHRSRDTFGGDPVSIRARSIKMSRSKNTDTSSNIRSRAK